MFADEGDFHFVSTCFFYLLLLSLFLPATFFIAATTSLLWWWWWWKKRNRRTTNERRKNYEKKSFEQLYLIINAYTFFIFNIHVRVKNPCIECVVLMNEIALKRNKWKMHMYKKKVKIYWNCAMEIHWFGVEMAQPKWKLWNKINVILKKKHQNVYAIEKWKRKVFKMI